MLRTDAGSRYPVSVQLALPFAAPMSDSPSVSPIALTSLSPVAPTSGSLIALTRVSPTAGASDSAIAPTSVSPFASTTEPVYFVRHRRARRYLLRVEHDGRVRVTIPRGGSRREADAFLARNGDWVARQRARLTPSSPGFEERHVLRARARSELPPRLLELAAQHGLAVTRVSIRSQRTRWGSCGRDGHISLNWRLVLMPPAVRDYVLIHELMHLRRLDHSRAYWRLVAAACPGYREAREWLRVNGPALR